MVWLDWPKNGLSLWNSYWMWTSNCQLQYTYPLLTKACAISPSCISLLRSPASLRRKRDAPYCFASKFTVQLRFPSSLSLTRSPCSESLKSSRVAIRTRLLRSSFSLNRKTMILRMLKTCSNRIERTKMANKTSDLQLWLILSWITNIHSAWSKKKPKAQSAVITLVKTENQCQFTQMSQATRSSQPATRPTPRRDKHLNWSFA